MLSYCSGLVSIYIHPSFYRSVKVCYSIDVGGESRDGRGTTELGTHSLRQTIGILTPNNHHQHLISKRVRMTLNLASLNMRGLRDPSKCAHLLDEISNLCVNVTAVQETHFMCAEDCQVLEGNLVVFWQPLQQWGLSACGTQI